MKRYYFYNNLIGWLVFIVAAIVYISTIEPSASFWDCGEFISTSDKLLVGHPPGAPFFMILGRLFILFAPDAGSVAAMVNIMSALASAFTILFLFWTITHLARKLVSKDNSMEEWQIWGVLGSGLVGALAYTFSDTFWFSAVEGEVYAMSSMFTAMVFWAILKWENVADEPHANRYLILIGYLMGLSIGVHLLNLLTIPAIVMVYYYKKFEVNRTNTLKALALSGAILVSILYVIIPGVIKVATWFELMFVNGFGLGFNSGVIFYAFLLVSALIAGIWYTYIKGKVILNTVITIVTVIMIGYSSFAMIVIRSASEPTMDQNSPDDVFSLMGYLNREQYGDRPLFFGQNYSSPIDRNASEAKKGDPIRVKKGDKYEIVEYKPEYVFDSKTTTIFPRMYSREPRHIQEYKSWANIKGRDVSVEDDYGRPKLLNIPTLGENIVFFVRYQIMHMYFRYFMWNFSGRQNDMQGNGEINKGNWITGIPFVDKAMYGDQSMLPEIYTKNKAHNTYFMLPLILGLIGLFFQFSKGIEGRRGFWIVVLLFFLTGLAIVIYLNQTPLQPRERDYAFAGSFYAFAIWIGLGVLGLTEWLKKYINGTTSAAIVTSACLVLVPGILASQNWDDHDRSERYVARDLAYNYLNSCQENAVIFTNGDNDTFPLWYIQEVEGVRTDVRVCNLSYLQTDWYIDQMKRKAYKSDPLPFSLTHDQYVTGTRDLVYLFERIEGRVDLKKGMEFLASDNPKTKQIPNYQGKVEHLPSKSFLIPVDSALVIKNGIVSPKNSNLIEKEVDIDIKKEYILKNEVMILDLLATNNWKRPVYFAVTVGSENYLGLQDYFQLEGFAYQVVPIKTKSDEMSAGRVDADRMYDNVKKFRWGGFNNPKVYLDENHIRMATSVRNNLGRLASALVDEGKNDKALEILNLTMDQLPPSRIPHNYFSIFLAEAYYKLGSNASGDKILQELASDNLKELKFYSSRGSANYYTEEMNRNMAIYMEIAKMADKYNRKEALKEFDTAYQSSLQRLKFYEN